MATTLLRPARFAAMLLAGAAVSGPTSAASIYDMTNLTNVIYNTTGAGPGGSPHTEFTPTGINDSGAIVGTAWAGPLDRAVAALVAPGLGSVTTYAAGNDAQNRAIQLEAYKINNNGDFVGDAWAFTSPVMHTPTESFAWVNNTAHLIDVVPGVGNRAMSINDAQTVIGHVDAFSYVATPPFLGANIIGLAEINNLPLGGYRVEDINDAGQIVGVYATDFYNQANGFLLTPRANVSLDNPAFLGDLPPVSLLSNGPVPLSFVDNVPLKEFRAFPEDVPERASALLLAAGLGALALRRQPRRHRR